MKGIVKRVVRLHCKHMQSSRLGNRDPTFIREDFEQWKERKDQKDGRCWRFSLRVWSFTCLFHVLELVCLNKVLHFCFLHKFFSSSLCFPFFNRKKNNFSKMFVPLELCFSFSSTQIKSNILYTLQNNMVQQTTNHRGTYRVRPRIKVSLLLHLH